MKKVEIIAVGNELLSGDILDTNSNWICKNISEFGGAVSRVVLVRDDLKAIENEIQTAIDREIDLVITMGGLGPTSDDMTLEAVANVTKNDLFKNAEAYEFIKKKYEDFAKAGKVDDPRMTPDREKMAIIPSGSILLDNPVGTAPAIYLKESNYILVSLPGVPPELKSIFNGSFLPVLKELFRGGYFKEKIIKTDCKDESLLAPILKKASEKFPATYFKSLATHFGKNVKMEILVSTRGVDADDTKKILNKSIQYFDTICKESGINIIDVKE